MKDTRIDLLAKNLCKNSCGLKEGQNLIIEGSEQTKSLIMAIVKYANRIGAYPFVRLTDEQIEREIMFGMDKTLADNMCKYAKPMFKDANAYIGIRANNNVYEMSGVPSENTKIFKNQYIKPIHIDIRAEKTNWVLVRWPNASFAQLAHDSLNEFEDFYFDVCNMDYKKMRRAMAPLKELMDKTNIVRIVAADTDLTFSIKGQKSVVCSGKHNVPDGEVFTAPVKDSLNGRIVFNIPTVKDGFEHSFIDLTFENGKVIKAKSNNTRALNAQLDSDEGSRFTGEFALGVNPFITRPIYDILFDEKMGGSIHIAMGNGYPECGIVNKSCLHWDLIQSHTKQYDGGEVYFDDVLVRKDGLFVLPELLGLNPENLKATKKSKKNKENTENKD